MDGYRFHAFVILCSGLEYTPSSQVGVVKANWNYTRDGICIYLSKNNTITAITNLAKRCVCGKSLFTLGEASSSKVGLAVDADDAILGVCSVFGCLCSK